MRQSLPIYTEQRWRKPAWYEAHHREKHGAMMKNTQAGAENYMKKGMSLALATQTTLGKNLLAAVQRHGTEGAVEFCNEKAIHLTDSMSTRLNASIKRVSDKNRNPANTANSDELAYIRQAKSEIKKNGEASPKMAEVNGKMLGYYPIMTNAMCLQCHGNPQTDINSPTFAALEQRYPQDKAIGYGANELRGIWVIEMEKIKKVHFSLIFQNEVYHTGLCHFYNISLHELQDHN